MESTYLNCVHFNFVLSGLTGTEKAKRFYFFSVKSNNLTSNENHLQSNFEYSKSDNGKANFFIFYYNVVIETGYRLQLKNRPFAHSNLKQVWPKLKNSQFSI